MLVTEQNGAQMWRQMLTENFNVTDQEKLGWVSQYAAIHEIHESQLGINAGKSPMASLTVLCFACSRYFGIMTL